MLKSQPDSGATLSLGSDNPGWRQIMIALRWLHGISDVSPCWCWWCYLHWEQISLNYHTSPHQVILNRLLGLPCLFHRKLDVIIIYGRVQVILMTEIANYAIDFRYIAVRCNQMIHTKGRPQSELLVRLLFLLRLNYLYLSNQQFILTILGCPKSLRNITNMN